MWKRHGFPHQIGSRPCSQAVHCCLQTCNLKLLNIFYSVTGLTTAWATDGAQCSVSSECDWRICIHFLFCAREWGRLVIIVWVVVRALGKDYIRHRTTTIRRISEYFHSLHRTENKTELKMCYTVLGNYEEIFWFLSSRQVSLQISVYSEAVKHKYLMSLCELKTKLGLNKNCQSFYK